MKKLLTIIFVLTLQNQAFTQMKTQFINTSIGKIAIHTKTVENTVPIIFMHGVYYDYHLWDYQTSRINDRTVIAIDMPLHGESRQDIKANWTLDDCANMLIEILQELEIEKTYAIGHSWGSMTILRAAHKQPNLFAGIGLCNMPYKTSEKQNKQLKIAHNFLLFRKFYTKQAAKSIIGKQQLKTNEKLLEYLQISMGKLAKADIKATDYAVIIRAEDATNLVENIEVPALALKGKDDYVGVPKNIEMTYVEGGHSSPIEAPEAVWNFINQVLEL